MAQITTPVSEDKCKSRHARMNVIASVLLGFCGVVGVMLGTDYLASSRAVDMANKVAIDAAAVSNDLRVHRAAVEERDKAVADKLKTFQDQMDKRFDAMIKALDRLGDKLDRYNGSNGSSMPAPMPDGPIAMYRP